MLHLSFFLQSCVMEQVVYFTKLCLLQCRVKHSVDPKAE